MLKIKSQEELESAFKSLKSGDLEFELDPKGKIEVSKFCIIHVKSGSPIIRVLKDARPKVYSWGCSSPEVNSMDSSRPEVHSKESSRPKVNSWNSSRPKVKIEVNKEGLKESEEPQDYKKKYEDLLKKFEEVSKILEGVKA